MKEPKINTDRQTARCLRHQIAIDYLNGILNFNFLYHIYSIVAVSNFHILGGKDHARNW